MSDHWSLVRNLMELLELFGTNSEFPPLQTCPGGCGRRHLYPHPEHRPRWSRRTK